MKTVSLVCMTLGVCALAGTGCSSLKIVEGNLAPPKWVGDPSAITNYEPHAFIYSSGISTYSSVLEEGINDARHDAIRKIVERVGVAADDVYRTDREEKRGLSQSGMPNVPQIIDNSRAAVRAHNSLDSKSTRTPEATHTSQTRLHGIDQELLSYSVWQYGPSWWARMWYGDTALRFYDVYVLLRCPRDEFEAAMAKERKVDALSESAVPEMKPAGGE